MVDFSGILREEAVLARTQISAFHVGLPLSCFPNAVWASASGAFRIISDILVIVVIVVLVIVVVTDSVVCYQIWHKAIHLAF